MGIQPIDLQNMYSQMNNIARNVGGQQQSAQVSQSVQQQNQIQKNIEMSQRVQQTENDKSNTNNVNPEGHKGGAGTYQNPNKKISDIIGDHSVELSKSDQTEESIHEEFADFEL